MLRLYPKAVICSFVLSAFCLKSSAQSPCTVSTLDIGTGISNGTSAPTPGQSDHYWIISSLSSAISVHYPTLTFPRPGHVPLHSALGWGSLSGSQWITIDDSTAHSGYYDSVTSQQYITNYQRTFTMCQEDDVTFSFAYINDNWVDPITVDGVSIDPGQGSTSLGYNAYSPSYVNNTIHLLPGTHTLQISVHNYPAPQLNPTGLSVSGSITGTISSIVNDEDPSCTSYSCNNDGECSDLCYWRVTGNNIQNGNNIFGTLNASNVNIVTNGSFRGVLTQGGSNASDPSAGRLGWNTANPTARLHVDCRYGNNPDNDPNRTSDIRFENLERGGGYALVIDDDGYVYNSGTRIDMSEFMAMKEEISQLKNEVALLRTQVSPTGVATETAIQQSWLGQNVPNPFGAETTIEYSVVNMQQSAYVVIYDLSGKELKKYQAAGKGKVTVTSETLVSGMYLYGLVIDGKQIDVKKMTLTK